MPIPAGNFRLVKLGHCPRFGVDPVLAGQLRARIDDPLRHRQKHNVGHLEAVAPLLEALPDELPEPGVLPQALAEGRPGSRDPPRDPAK